MVTDISTSVKPPFEWLTVESRESKRGQGFSLENRLDAVFWKGYSQWN